jgi:serine/threonine protein kinase
MGYSLCTQINQNVFQLFHEYVPGGLFFDLCQTAGGMGEQGGRYFMEQLKDVLVYLSAKRVAHRDLKLENIMVNDDL